ncbi:hypothetical protein TNCV_983151 [Trichonephila clavipes]|nr:hypothetical protein TNCV_983151 [Trichonephila clavipes]
MPNNHTIWPFMTAVNFLNHENPPTWDGVQPASLGADDQQKPFYATQSALAELYDNNTIKHKTFLKPERKRRRGRSRTRWLDNIEKCLRNIGVNRLKTIAINRSIWFKRTVTALAGNWLHSACEEKIGTVVKKRNSEYHSQFCCNRCIWLNGYVNKQNCRIWSEANVYVETPLHSEKLKWAGGIIGHTSSKPITTLQSMVIGIEPDY